MPTAFWKEPFLDMARKIWAMPEEKWIDDSPRLTDTELLEKYATLDSSIDEVNYRKEVLDAWKGNHLDLCIKELPGRVRVVILGTAEQVAGIDWVLWSRIFQAIEHPIGHVLFYAHSKKRDFPTDSRDLRASHINGGFTYICSQDIIVLYRYEEATRVLLHELLHTACFDKELGVEDLEANTEAWAEVLLCALKSRGNTRAFLALWREQVSWIYAQCEYIETRLNVRSKADYAWRYMTGKKHVLANLGFFQGITLVPVENLSPRFTSPIFDTI
jgi:hypothetical protein